MPFKPLFVLGLFAAALAQPAHAALKVGSPAPDFRGWGGHSRRRRAPRNAKAPLRGLS